ncbi:MAG: hypothetical protein IJE40_05675 [Clostridia bacterium]|nr:hypothetical protein [Clostridia bacterium]
MDKIFPPMYSKPEKRHIIALIPCFFWVFVLIPMYMPYLFAGLWEQGEISVWIDIIYHVVNGILMLLILRSYLSDEWFMFTTDVRFYIKHIALTVGIIMVTVFLIIGILYFYYYDISHILQAIPIVEMFVSHTPLAVLGQAPIFGTLAISLFTPISICALFFCIGFAPICNRKPWLAYLCVAVISFFPALINILWRNETSLALNGYILQLPVHLIACWSYQKTDNVFTPMISLAVVNLLLSVIFIFVVIPMIS